MRLLLMILLLLSVIGCDQLNPGSENGRYQVVKDMGGLGVLRMDTRTGELALCSFGKLEPPSKSQSMPKLTDMKCEVFEGTKPK